MRLLVTAAGTGTGYAYAQAKARSFPDITLFTGDVNPAEQVTASLFAERHVRLPASAAGDYFQVLDGAIREWGIDAYLPLIDSEATRASAMRATLPANVACNSLAFCQAAAGKSRYADWLAFDGVVAPRALAQHELRSPLRLIAKQDGSFGGRATRLVETADEGSRLLQQGWTLYPYIDGEEFTVDCFPLDGHVMVSVRQRLEVKSGVCTKARIVGDATLSALALHLCRQFALTEPFCFQTRKTGDLHYLIDLNPRLGAGTAMSALNGMDFFAAHLAKLTGASPLPFLRPRFSECVVTRQYSDYLMSVAP